MVIQATFCEGHHRLEGVKGAAFDYSSETCCSLVCFSRLGLACRNRVLGWQGDSYEVVLDSSLVTLEPNCFSLD